MKITVIKQTIALTEDETLIRKSGVTYPVEFLFDPTWDGYEKTALFQAGDITVSVPLVDDTCDIPAECLENAGVFLKVRVRGTKDGVDQVTPWGLTSRILYDTAIDILMPSDDDEKTGEFGRLCDDFANALETQYTEEELVDKTLSEVISTMDTLQNTATDGEVDGMLDDVWGPD